MMVRRQGEWGGFGFWKLNAKTAMGKVVIKTHEPGAEIRPFKSHKKILSIPLRSSCAPVAGEHASPLTGDDHFTAAIVFSVTALLRV